MASPLANAAGVSVKLLFARRKFHAWWEGYAFDAAEEGAAIQAQLQKLNGAGTLTNEHIIAETIWGEGRLEPGAPAWTMRFVRQLSLPVRARVIILGAGAGAPIRDLKHGTRWKVTGLTRAEGASHSDLRSYDAAFQRLNKGAAAGAMSFFEMHRDADPSSFVGFAHELTAPGAKAVFVDYTVARKGVRLRSCFPSTSHGTPRTQAEYHSVLQDAGFSVAGTLDETRAFIPLIAKGWAGWRRAYDAIMNMENARLRAELLCAMAAHAKLWADRFDALRSGQLQVTSFRAVRN